MQALLFLMLVAIIPAIATAICWLLIRRFTDTTKYAWAMSLAIGYALGHVCLVAWMNLPEEVAASASFGAWAKELPAGFQAILWPKSSVDWLPLGVLLAGLVSVNSALFPFQRTITLVGASLISIWLAVQLIGGKSVMTEDWLTAGIGLKLGLGFLALWLCWISAGNSIQGRSRVVWITCIAALAASAVATLAILGKTSLATFGAILISCMVSGFLTSLMRTAGTDNIRFSGAVVSLSSISLLLVGYWFTGTPWYPLALIVVGFVVVNSWMPPYVRGPRWRMSLALGCSALAVTASILIRQGVL